ncbi:hypothetical protein ACQJBY_055055 [Aegilops geniculata]
MPQRLHGRRRSSLPASDLRRLRPDLPMAPIAYYSHRSGDYEHCSLSLPTSCLQALHNESSLPRWSSTRRRCTLPPCSSNPRAKWLQSVTALLQCPKAKSCSDIILHGSVVANAATPS